MIAKLDGFVFRPIFRGPGKEVRILVRDERGLIHQEVASGFRTVEAGMKSEVLRRCADEARARTVLPTQADARVLPPPGALAPDGSFIAGILNTCRQLERGSWSASRKEENRRAGRYILTHLGQEVLRPDLEVTSEHLARVREALETDKEIEKSKSHYRDLMSFVLGEMQKRGHLLPECLAVFDGLSISSSPHRKCGKPYSNEDLRKLLAAEANAPSYLRMALWNGISGGPQAIDALTLKCAELDRKSGLVRFKRQKTGGRAEYFLVREGVDCANRQPIRDGQPFVVAEGPLKPTGSPIDVNNSQTRKRITGWFNTRWRALAKKAGVDPEDKSYKSLRQHLVSCLDSEPLALALIARVLGNKVRAVPRYSFVLDGDLEFHRDLRQRHLEALLSGRTGEYILTDKQLLEQIEHRLAESFQALGAQLEGEQSRPLTTFAALASRVEAGAQPATGEGSNDGHNAHQQLLSILEGILDQFEFLSEKLKSRTRQNGGTAPSATQQASSQT